MNIIILMVLFLKIVGIFVFSLFFGFFFILCNLVIIFKKYFLIKVYMMVWFVWF